MNLSETPLADQTDLQMWSFLVGFFMPMLVAVFQQPKWKNWVRSLFTVGSCIIAGGVTMFLEHGFHADEHLVTNILQVLVMAQASYLAFWKPTKIADKIESATDVLGGERHTD